MKKPKWENIYKNINKIILERVEHYLQNIFNGKYFRNDINPNLGSYEVLSKEILKDLYQNQEFPPDKQKEIDIMINKNIVNAVNLFNKKREELPYFEDILINKEKLCN